MKKFTMAILTMAMVLMISLSASAEGKGFEGCTIRTIRDNTVVTNATKSMTIEADRTFKVLNATEDKFEIMVNDEIFAINSDEVFVNLKDFVPSLEVNLVMADKAIFQMAGEEIPGLWGEKFYNRNGSEQGTEAWVTVETAKKLAEAQEIFLADGKTIVVYDAYRPYSTTKKFQSAYRAYLNTKTNQFKQKWFGNLGESWFLAQKASSHNYGIAVDISLRDLETGEILEMPAPMHNLDYRSAEYNWVNGNSTACENARYLAKVMKQVGMKSLKSEWWHFQNGSTPKELSPVDIPN